MKIFTREEWNRSPYKGEWAASPWNMGQVEAGDIPAGYIGRRTMMVGGDHGVTLLTEGVHFLVEGDYSHLPVLRKSNAIVGACYQFAGGYIEVTRLYRISEEEALEKDLYCLERVEYIQHAAWGELPGGCGLMDGDIRTTKHKEESK